MGARVRVFWPAEGQWFEGVVDGVGAQDGRPIFHMAASFQTLEEGIEHQIEMPQVDGPEGLADRSDVPEEVLEQLHEKYPRLSRVNV